MILRKWRKAVKMMISSTSLMRWMRRHQRKRRSEVGTMQITFDTKDDLEDLKRLHNMLGSLINKRSSNSHSNYSSDNYSQNDWNAAPLSSSESSSTPEPETNSPATGGLFGMFDNMEN